MSLLLWWRSKFRSQRRVTGRQGRRKAVRLPRLVPRLEFLESRRVLSCDAFDRDSTLFVTGDENANNLLVREDGAYGVTVACAGRTLVENAIVDRVEINSFGGPDTINCRRIGNLDTQPGDHRVREVMIDSGDGGDLVDLNVNLSSQQPGGVIPARSR